MPKKPVEEKKDEAIEETKKKDKAAKDDDVIVAGTVDTSSDFSFKVNGAFVGMDEYSDDPVVILVGEFTNNSKEPVSPGSILGSDAYQSGRELHTAYLRGASAYTFDKIEPGVTSPIIIGWELVSATDKVEITITDSQHYAKEVLFNKSYTVEELIANTKQFIEEFSGIVDEGKSLSV